MNALTRDRAVLRRVIASGSLLLAVAFWSGCAAMKSASTTSGEAASSAQAKAPPALAPPSPEALARDAEALRERAAEFWKARVALDATKQWELLEPRGRGRMAPAEYGGVPRAVKYLAYQVEDANIRGYFGTVKVRLIVQPVLPSAPNRRIAPAAVVIDDSWVKIQGTWYRALEQEEGRRPTETQQ
jgi:hypothetical protein